VERGGHRDATGRWRAGIVVDDIGRRLADELTARPRCATTLSRIRLAKQLGVYDLSIGQERAIDDCARRGLRRKRCR